MKWSPPWALGLSLLSGPHLRPNACWSWACLSLGHHRSGYKLTPVCTETWEWKHRLGQDRLPSNTLCTPPEEEGGPEPPGRRGL